MAMRRRICSGCVGETYLAQEVEAGGTAGSSYCGQANACISVEDLADRIGTAFEDHYVRTSRISRIHCSSPCCLTGNQTTSGSAKAFLFSRCDRRSCLDTAATRQQMFLRSSIAGTATSIRRRWAKRRSSRPTRTTRRKARALWRGMRSGTASRVAKTEARFFSRTAADLLARVFGNIDKLKAKPRHPLVVNVGTEQQADPPLSRPRLPVRREAERSPVPPGPSFGIASGRPCRRGPDERAGESLSSTVRPMHLSPWLKCALLRGTVAVAKFSIIRPLRFLDLTAIEGVRDGALDPVPQGRLRTRCLPTVPRPSANSA